eukprot:3228207-Pyramimonas_sp.AAC.1
MKVPAAPRVAQGGCWSRRPVVKPAGCSPRPHFTGYEGNSSIAFWMRRWESRTASSVLRMCAGHAQRR